MKLPAWLNIPNLLLWLIIGLSYPHALSVLLTTEKPENAWVAIGLGAFLDFSLAFGSTVWTSAKNPKWVRVVAGVWWSFVSVCCFLLHVAYYIAARLDPTIGIALGTLFVVSAAALGLIQLGLGSVHETSQNPLNRLVNVTKVPQTDHEPIREIAEPITKELPSVHEKLPKPLPELRGIEVALPKDHEPFPPNLGAVHEGLGTPPNDYQKEQVLLGGIAKDTQDKIKALGRAFRDGKIKAGDFDKELEKLG